MPNTYTQIYIQFVCAVKNRQSLITSSIRERIEKYITGIVQNLGHKLLAIYCMPDHAHVLVGFKPDQSMADLMREVKSRSFEFINREKLTQHKFNWQEGYGAFSYSKSHMAGVISYVLGQPEHHQKISFREEYIQILKEFDIQYNDQYLFDWITSGTTPTEPVSD